MKTKRRHAQQRWMRQPPVTRQYRDSLPAPPMKKDREPARQPAQHLGPYEDRYDVTLGYGFERAIVTP